MELQLSTLFTSLISQQVEVLNINRKEADIRYTIG